MTDQCVESAVTNGSVSWDTQEYVFSIKSTEILRNNFPQFAKASKRQQ